MSMFGNIAIEGELERLLALLEANKQLPADELLAKLTLQIKEDLAAAKSGWL